MRQKLQMYEVLWTSDSLRCVLSMPDVLPQTYFVQVFNASDAIFTQRCESINDAAQLAETLRRTYVRSH